MLTSIEVQKVINKHNLISSKFFKNNKHFQYEYKLPYNTMQVTRLLLLNNPPQRYHNHKYRMLTSIEVQKVINKYNSTISIQISKCNKHSQHQLQ